MSAEESREVSAAKVVCLKAAIVQVAGTIRMFSEGVKFEFEPDQTGDMKISEEILSAVATAQNLVLSVQASGVSAQFQESGLREFRAEVERSLRDLADTLEQMSWSSGEPEPELLQQRFEITEPKSVGMAIDGYRKLKRLCQGIVSAPAVIAAKPSWSNQGARSAHDWYPFTSATVPARWLHELSRLVRGLAAFEADLHIHLENNILFPRVVELAHSE